MIFLSTNKLFLINNGIKYSLIDFILSFTKNTRLTLSLFKKIE